MHKIPRPQIELKFWFSLFSSLPHTHRAPSRLPALAQTFEHALRALSDAYLLRKLPPAVARIIKSQTHTTWSSTMVCTYRHHQVVWLSVAARSRVRERPACSFCRLRRQKIFFLKSLRLRPGGRILAFLGT